MKKDPPAISSEKLGFADYKRDLPALKDLPEIGWAFTTQARGQGYATESVRAVVAWGDAHFPSPRTACIIHPENLASIRVAEKCAYREFQRATYKSHPTIILVRDRILSP
ncbi:MAG: GNAT family N-acetyltransferase [Candidatus Acidiferrales bacterium]